LAAEARPLLTRCRQRRAINDGIRINSPDGNQLLSLERVVGPFRYRLPVRSLFEVISRAYEHHSMLVTNNLPFESRPKDFGNEQPTADRLTYRVYTWKRTVTAWLKWQGNT
jgi:hypothetical protein